MQTGGQPASWFLWRPPRVLNDQDSQRTVLGMNQNPATPCRPGSALVSIVAIDLLTSNDTYYLCQKQAFFPLLLVTSWLVCPFSLPFNSASEQ